MIATSGRPATLRDGFVAGALLALALVAILVPFVLYAVSRADYEWAISGPGVFGQLGSGPYLLWLSVSWFLLALGLLVTALGILREKRSIALPGAALAGVGALAAAGMTV